MARLLAAAEADLKARRLTSPVGNNAWEKYQEVLKLDSGNPEATAGMERVIGSYMELFGTAVEQEDFDKAAGYLAKIRELHPDSPVLEEGEQGLAAARQARANRLVEQERQRQTEEAERQAELERQRLVKAIQEHWTAFEAAMQTQDLYEAAGMLVQIRDLNPEAPGLAQGEERLEELEKQLIEQVIKEHWVAFEAALEAEDLDEAADILAQVRDLNPEDLELTENKQRLAEARQTALVREYAGEMVSIPGGTFRMGDLNGEGGDDERPVHTVTVPAFRMGKYEVTFAQWDACTWRTGVVGVTGRMMKAGVRGNRPVINVSWDDIQGFIDWLNDKTSGNFRLPTEAEWEYATRAGSSTKYSWGNSVGSNLANCEGCGSRWDDARTAPVGSFSANVSGLHDVHGNVWEWVQDCYTDSYVGAPTDGRSWTNGDCDQRLYRGGSFSVNPQYLRSANRAMLARTDRFYSRGFRLARDK